MTNEVQTTPFQSASLDVLPQPVSSSLRDVTAVGVVPAVSQHLAPSVDSTREGENIEHVESAGMGVEPVEHLETFGEIAREVEMTEHVEPASMGAGNLLVSEPVDANEHVEASINPVIPSGSESVAQSVSEGVAESATPCNNSELSANNEELGINSCNNSGVPTNSHPMPAKGGEKQEECWKSGREVKKRRKQEECWKSMCSSSLDLGRFGVGRIAFEKLPLKEQAKAVISMGSELVLFALKKIEKPFVELQKLKLFSKTYGWRLEPTNKWGEGMIVSYLRDAKYVLQSNVPGSDDFISAAEYVIPSGYAWTCDLSCSDNEEDFTGYSSSPQTNPIVGRIECKVGHGCGRPTQKLIDEAADRYSSMAKALSASWIEAPYVLQRYVWLKIN
ncbi:hypothetical protein V6N11_039035 [Hibiscus sabdariffa]|uniref:Uncharacterized protein n=1 Tax=Hibiscus sabdariffa TaxID=183260 RepID=A0ABR2SM11_9ROSI